MPVSDDSILKKSGQWWKALAAFWILVLSCLTLAVTVNFTLSVRLSTIIIISTLALSTVVSALACLAIRCPNCKSRWLWHAAAKSKFNGWLSSLLEAKSCPQCGYPASRQPHEQPRELVHH
jgi:hypothetical protein